MRGLYPKESLQALCDLFGKSRQAWYQSETHGVGQEELNGKLLAFVKNERKDQPRIGTKKLQFMINKAFADQGIFIGRDRLAHLLRSQGLLIRRRRKYHPVMTNGNGQSIYPDLRKGLIVNEINQLWCCDITYVKLNTSDRFGYGTFVTDEKSHLIVGYHFSLEMTAAQTLIALDLAVEKELGEQEGFNHSLIFHTDRGSQFKSALFRAFHDQYQIRMSMAEQGKSSENPVSERLNGILKNELMIQNSFDSFDQAKRAIDRAVNIYNERRPHLSCNFLTPKEAHKPGLGLLKKLWKQRKKKSKLNLKAKSKSHNPQAVEKKITGNE